MAVLRERADKLVERGKKRGFVTYDEILKEFPNIESNVLFLDKLYERLSSTGIDVLEKGNLLGGRQRQRHKEEESGQWGILRTTSESSKRAFQGKGKQLQRKRPKRPDPGSARQSLYI